MVFSECLRNQTFLVSTNRIAVLDSCVSRNGSVGFRHIPKQNLPFNSFLPVFRMGGGGGGAGEISSWQNHRLKRGMLQWDSVPWQYSKPNFSSFNQQNCSIGQLCVSQWFSWLQAYPKQNLPFSKFLTIFRMGEKNTQFTKPQIVNRCASVRWRSPTVFKTKLFQFQPAELRYWTVVICWDLHGAW